MADHYPKETKESQSPTKVGEEGQGCGMFDFLKKKENEKPHQEQEQHKHTLAEKLHHHDGDSSSVSYHSICLSQNYSQNKTSMNQQVFDVLYK